MTEKVVTIHVQVGDARELRKLDELLKEIEAVMEKTRSRSVTRRDDEKIIIELPTLTKQDLGEKMQGVYAKILENADEQGLVLFSSIVDENNIIEIVTTFLCLLFLAAKGKVHLWQESFFGEIFIALPDKK